MILRLLVRLSVTVALATSLHASAQSDLDQIRAEYHRFERAFEQHDYRSFGSFFSDSFHVHRKGRPTMDRAQSITALEKENRETLPPIHVRLQPVKVALSGETARVHISEQTSYRRLGHDGKVHTLRYIQHFDDEWVKTPAGWRVNATFYPGPPSAIYVDGELTSREEAGKKLMGE
jgi:hypothetical protein